MVISDELKERLWDAVRIRNVAGASSMPHQLADILDEVEVALWTDKLGYTPQNIGVMQKNY